MPAGSSSDSPASSPGPTTASRRRVAALRCAIHRVRRGAVCGGGAAATRERESVARAMPECVLAGHASVSRFGRHRGQDPGGIQVAQRPQDALADDRISGPDRRRGNLRSGGGQDVGGRFDIEPVDQLGHSVRVEVVDGGSGSRQVDVVTSFGCQVQVGPVHDVPAHAAGQASTVRAGAAHRRIRPRHREFEPPVRRRDRQDVGDPGESLTDDVNDLGVQHVAHQQDFIATEAVDGRGDREGGRVNAGTHQDTGVFELVDRGPRHKQIGCSAPPDEESLHHPRPCILIEIDGEISQATDRPNVGSQHILASFAAQQEHRIPMKIGHKPVKIGHKLAVRSMNFLLPRPDRL